MNDNKHNNIREDNARRGGRVSAAASKERREDLKESKSVWNQFAPGRVSLFPPRILAGRTSVCLPSRIFATSTLSNSETPMPSRPLTFLVHPPPLSRHPTQVGLRCAAKLGTSPKEKRENESSKTQTVSICAWKLHSWKNTCLRERKRKFHELQV